MRFIGNDNSLLDELEDIARPKKYSFLVENHRALTFKTASDYLPQNSRWSLESGDQHIYSNAAIAISETEVTRLKSVAARFIKRCFDIAGAAIGLVLTLPFWLIIPVLVKSDSKGPVFYTQTRVGRNRRESRRRLIPQEGAGNSRQRERRRENTYGETFRIIKFRTMVDRA
ncbi:MAG: sugar transferase, partial [Candidatus Zixiibacteriota bacterium]